MEGADVERLEQLKKIIEEKSSSAANPNGTKAQLKPSFDAEGKCAKIVIVVKWGGEVRGIAFHLSIKSLSTYLLNIYLPISLLMPPDIKLEILERICERVI